jgi:hypothetical protein
MQTLSKALASFFAFCLLESSLTCSLATSSLNWLGEGLSVAKHRTSSRLKLSKHLLRLLHDCIYQKLARSSPLSGVDSHYDQPLLCLFLRLNIVVSLFILTKYHWRRSIEKKWRGEASIERREWNCSSLCSIISHMQHSTVLYNAEVGANLILSSKPCSHTWK